MFTLRKLKILYNYWSLQRLIKKATQQKCKKSCQEKGDCSIVLEIQTECKKRGFVFWEEEFFINQSDGLYAYLGKNEALVTMGEGNRPCYGKTMLKILEKAGQRFETKEMLLKTLEADHCPDGTPKNPSVCKYSWRGEVCKLCPMHDQ